MDSLGYIILNALLLAIILCSFVLLKFKSSKFSLIFPISTFITSLGMFFAYLYGLYGAEHTDGIPVTFAMRVFMLDDSVTDSNIIIGYATSLILVAVCIIYAIIFVQKYKSIYKS